MRHALLWVPIASSLGIAACCITPPPPLNPPPGASASGAPDSSSSAPGPAAAPAPGRVDKVHTEAKADMPDLVSTPKHKRKAPLAQ
jgi:hypothetical protein